MEEAWGNDAGEICVAASEEGLIFQGVSYGSGRGQEMDADIGPYLISWQELFKAARQAKLGVQP